MARDTILTPEGLEDLKAKIELLRTVRRREVAERIKEAREFGDISENSEYDDAKNEQAMLEKQIADLEEKLRNARVIDTGDVDTESVGVGVTVHVKDQKTEKSAKYMLVGSAEANPAEAKLSNESPVGKALMGRKRGDVVTVPVPRGPARKLKITKIEGLRLHSRAWRSPPLAGWRARSMRPPPAASRQGRSHGFRPWMTVAEARTPAGARASIRSRTPSRA